LELSSLPGTNGVLQYLASHPMPMHATIICGLVKNQVPKTIHLAFLSLIAIL
jgi:methionine S-methyltransferase